MAVLKYYKEDGTWGNVGLPEKVITPDSIGAIPTPDTAENNQILTYKDGEWVAENVPDVGVTSVNGQTGDVTIEVSAASVSTKFNTTLFASSWGDGGETPEEPVAPTYPDNAFFPVTKLTAGKQYALVAKIDGNYRYINTTTYNNYTMNATQVTVTQNSGYVTFGSEPALFTAAASGSGFTLANGSNYLHGTTSSGTALRVGTTAAVWTVDTSATGGFSSGKYLTKEDNNAVWLKCNDGTYDWSIKYETAGSFGYDREGRDNTYSTGFASFILYEKNDGENGGGSSAPAITNKYVIANDAITPTCPVELLPRENEGITKDQLEALSGAMIVGGAQSSGSITLVALGEVPTIDIPVTLIIRGDL